MSGIVSYGAYIPFNRLQRATIGKALETRGGKGERAVASYDEDTATMAVEAARTATSSNGREKIRHLYFASTSAPYQEKLNAATHDRIGDLFGIANLSSLAHLAAMIRADKVVASDGGDAYLPDDPVRLRGNLANFRFPIRFIHGAMNECFLPSSTQRTLELLRDAHPDIEYDREVIAEYGHIDCIFGADARSTFFEH